MNPFRVLISEMVMRPSSPANPGVPMFGKSSANVLHVLCDGLQMFCKCSANVLRLFCNVLQCSAHVGTSPNYKM